MRMKEIDQVRMQAEKQGWIIEGTKGGHLKWTPPDSKFSPYFSSVTPGDYRSVKNLRAALRQRGFDDGRARKNEGLRLRSTAGGAIAPHRR